MRRTRLLGGAHQEGLRKMRRTIPACGVLLLALGLSTSWAQAAGTDPQTPFHGSLDGGITGFNNEPGAVLARCGEEWEWITQTGGSGEVSGIGEVTFTTEHCARIVTMTAEGAIIRLGSGVLTLSRAGGDLYLAYDGMVAFKGDLSTGAGSAPSPSRYVVVDGTGDFEGASGDGSIFTSVDSYLVHHELHGSLRIGG